MDSVLRALAMYAVLLLIFRLVGKRSLSQITTFDFVILLVVGEATQQALLGEDFSLTRAALVIATLILAERFSDYLSWRFPRFQRATESIPVVLVEDGEVVAHAMRKSHLSVDDIVTAGPDHPRTGTAGPDQVGGARELGRDQRRPEAERRPAGVTR